MLTASLILIGIEFALVMRVMLRRHREPMSRVAWVAVIALLPVVGCLAYILFGEVNIGKAHIRRRQQVMEGIT